MNARTRPQHRPFGARLRPGAIAALVLIASCARREDAKIAAVHEDKDVVAHEQLPVVRTKADVVMFDHKRVVMLGIYDVEPVHHHKRKGGHLTSIVLSDGTMVCFDDWFMYKGNPNQGEQRAFREFLEAHPHWQAIPYQPYSVFCNSFILSRR